jgi:hypothetical protein
LKAKVRSLFEKRILPLSTPQGCDEGSGRPALQAITHSDCPSIGALRQLIVFTLFLTHNPASAIFAKSAKSFARVCA